MSDNVFKGKVWKFGDDINTDLVIPGYALAKLPECDPADCFNANRPGWYKEVSVGDVIVGGRNFGVGSARPIGDMFLACGIRGIIADTFNGLGLRNCVNAGLPVLPVPGVTDAFDEGDVAEVDWSTGEVRNVTKGTTTKGTPIPQALQDIILAGGVEAVLRAEGFLAPKAG